MAQRASWFRDGRELSPRGGRVLALLSFALPLLSWCVISYVPFVWHPMRKITDAGDVSWFSVNQLVETEAFETANQEAASRGARAATGTPANPVFLPAPHQVAKALVTGFSAHPARPDEPWLHQSLWHSITVIF